MGCRKLTYYPNPELKISYRNKELTKEKTKKSLRSEYVFGFQSQEKDDEISGSTGTHYNFTFRMHDARIGRFWSVDPLTKKYPFYSPYAFSGNRVIDAFELEGLEPVVENGNIVGYNVQEGQGPSQISADISNPETQKNYGYYLNETQWYDIVYADEKYFPEENFNNRMDINDPGYTRLNMNPGDFIDLSLISGYKRSNLNITLSGSKASSLQNIGKFGNATEFFGIVSQVSGYAIYSEQLDNWFSTKNLRSYKVSNFYGNKQAGSIKISKNISNNALKLGRWLGSVDYVTNTIQWQTGQMTDYEYYREQTSNVISDVLPGVYGVAWNIGWETGRVLSTTRSYQKAKYWFQSDVMKYY